MTAAQRAAHRSAAAKSPSKSDTKSDATSGAHPDTMTRRLEKSAAAFRTISEVAEELDVPQHVLRFWESKFPQVRPLKRGGGRRYYRPEDVDLLGRIRQLLYKDGYTIKGVQRLMREGALKAKREVAPEGTADAADTAETGLEGADATAGPLDAGMRAELRSLLGELVALKTELGRLTG